MSVAELPPLYALEDTRITHSVLLNDPKTSVEEKRQQIRDYFLKTFAQHERLYEVLKDDTVFYTKAINLRHPLVFYFCHTAAFFVNKLFLGRFIPERVDPELEFTVAVGVDEMSWDDCNSAHFNWPKMDVARNFRNKVREVVDNLIQTAELSLPVAWDSPFWAVLMGIEHERIHLETSSVLIRQHKLERVVDHEWWGQICPEDSTPPENELVTIPQQTVKLGKVNQSPDTFGWDNEYGDVTENVAEFKASKYLVSNAEWKTFMEAGGYSTQRWWTEEGWRWVTQMKITKPEFWVIDESAPEGYTYRTMLKVIPMPWSWPVDANYLEGKAFCNWRTEVSQTPIRLPSEAEWYAMVQHAKLPDLHEWVLAGEKAPGNYQLNYWASSCPVDKFKQGDLYDIVGNVWQWTETWFDAVDTNFRFHPLYHDFSSPTFDKKHNVIKGGSWISTGNEATFSGRYAFRRHFFQHAGFRYIESVADVKQTENRLVHQTSGSIFETEVVTRRSLEAHYGPEYLDVPNFPKRSAEICNNFAQELGLKDKALDLGCGTGRSTFELTRQFAKVLGADKSARMLWSAMDMQQLERVLWPVCDEAELYTQRQATLSDLGLSKDCFVRLAFEKLDAEDLPETVTDYDLVHAGLLLEYLKEPKAFLQNIRNRIKTGGLLVLTSTYAWSEEWTPQSNWIGGFVDMKSENVPTAPALKEFMLANGWEEYKPPQEITFVERFTSREFRHSTAQLTAWRKV